MTTASEADLIRRNQDLHQQLAAARAELSREATAAAGLQDELRALLGGLRRVAYWVGAVSHSADDIIAAINRSDDTHSKALTEQVALRRAAEADLHSARSQAGDLTARLQDAVRRHNELLGVQEENKTLRNQVEAHQRYLHGLGQYLISAHAQNAVDDNATAILDGYDRGGEHTIEGTLRLLRLAKARGAFNTTKPVTS